MSQSPIGRKIGSEQTQETKEEILDLDELSGFSTQNFMSDKQFDKQ